MTATAPFSIFRPSTWAILPLFPREEAETDGPLSDSTKTLLEHPLVAANPPRRRPLETEGDFLMRLLALRDIRAFRQMIEQEREKDRKTMAIIRAKRRVIDVETGRIGTVTDLRQILLSVHWDGDECVDMLVDLRDIEAFPREAPATGA